LWIRSKYRKYKYKINVTSTILAILVLTTILVLVSYKHVDSLSQGALINNTEERINDGTYKNVGYFIGLGSSFKTIPNTNILISFSNENQKNIENNYPSITARVKEGVKL
jgi:hypothetical protein